MSHGALWIVAIGVIGLGVVTTSALAIERPRAAPWKHWLPLKLWREGDPRQVSVGPPGPHRYPEHAGGNYPWYGYGLGVPVYNWGYFGAHYHGMLNSYHGYHEDFYQYSCQRGY